LEKYVYLHDEAKMYFGNAISVSKELLPLAFGQDLGCYSGVACQPQQLLSVVVAGVGNEMTLPRQMAAPIH
jgi:hypothetical protein